MRAFLRKNWQFILITSLFFILSIAFYLFIPKEDNVKRNLVSVEADKFVLEISDRLPISDYTASSLDSVEIDSDVLDNINFSIASVSNKMINYEIGLFDEKNSEFIDGEYVKVLLTDASGNNYNLENGHVPSFSQLSDSVRFFGYKKVYSDKLAPGHIKQYNIKIWVSDDYLVKSSGKKFTTKLVVKSI